MRTGNFRWQAIANIDIPPKFPDVQDGYENWECITKTFSDTCFLHEMIRYPERLTALASGPSMEVAGRVGFAGLE